MRTNLMALGFLCLVLMASAEVTYLNETVTKEDLTLQNNTTIDYRIIKCTDGNITYEFWNIMRTSKTIELGS